MPKYDDFYTFYDKKEDRFYRLGVAWTVSRGYETYGYNICSLWDLQYDRKVASCNGGGYDMTGTVIAEWIHNNFYGRLQKLDKSKNRFSGLSHYNTKNKSIKRIPPTKRGMYKTYLNGACGVNSIMRIAKAIGLTTH